MPPYLREAKIKLDTDAKRIFRVTGEFRMPKAGDIFLRESAERGTGDLVAGVAPCDFSETSRYILTEIKETT